MANVFNRVALLLIALLLAVAGTMPASAAGNRIMLGEAGHDHHDHGDHGGAKDCPDHGEAGHDHSTHHDGDCAEAPLAGALEDAAGTITSDTSASTTATTETVAPISAGFSSSGTAAVAAVSAAAMAVLAL